MNEKETFMLVETGTYLGPATVVGIEKNNTVTVRMPDGESCRARLALSLPYQAVEGDEVLAIRQEGETAFVIGLLQSQGKATLRVAGDLSIEAPNGKIDFSSAKGISLCDQKSITAEAPHVQISAGKLELLAEQVIQRAKNIYQWVSELVQTRSRRFRMMASSTFQLHSHRTYLQADADMNVRGKKINLG